MWLIYSSSRGKIIIYTTIRTKIEHLASSGTYCLNNWTVENYKFKQKNS